MHRGLSTDRLPVTALILSTAFALLACSTPVAEPTVTQAPVPTLTETFAPIGGSGIIRFGVASALNEDTLRINPSKDTFKAGNKDIAWSAEFTEPADATTLTWILAKVGKSGSEQIIWRQDVDVSNPTFDLFANHGDISLLVDRKPGTYVMRYLRDSTVLAEGKFTLTK